MNRHCAHLHAGFLGKDGVAGKVLADGFDDHALGFAVRDGQQVAVIVFLSMLNPGVFKLVKMPQLDLRHALCDCRK
jgi:hypothetical protein